MSSEYRRLAAMPLERSSISLRLPPPPSQPPDVEHLLSHVLVLLVDIRQQCRRLFRLVELPRLVVRLDLSQTGFLAVLDSLENLLLLLDCPDLACSAGSTLLLCSLLRIHFFSPIPCTLLACAAQDTACAGAKQSTKGACAAHDTDGAGARQSTTGACFFFGGKCVKTVSTQGVRMQRLNNKLAGDAKELRQRKNKKKLYQLV